MRAISPTLRLDRAAAFRTLREPAHPHRPRADGQGPTLVSSARAAAPPTRNGPAAATLAAPGTASSRKRPASPAPAAGGKARGRRIDLVPLVGRGGAAAAARSAASTSSTACWAAASSPAAALLIGGDPGIGKSTLLLQAAAAIAAPGREVVYVSGEESVAQVRLRARRASAWPTHRSQLASATSVGDILATLDGRSARRCCIVDSIQTMWVDALDRRPARSPRCAPPPRRLIRFAKQRGTAVLLVGHVTKDGQIAGPRVLEHMVDTVLYFEGERGHQFRILRAVKNRFGPANEIGVFEMTEAGLGRCANPSALFLADREDGDRRLPPSSPASRARGRCWSRSRRWSRPARLAHAAPRGGRLGRRPARHAAGRARGALRHRDRAPATSISTSPAACGSGARGRPGGGGGAHLRPTGPPGAAAAVFFGEVGLAGEVRAVGHAEARLKEATKLGFQRAIMPRTRQGLAIGLGARRASRLADLVGVMGGTLPRAAQAGRLSGDGMQLTLFDVIVIAIVGHLRAGRHGARRRGRDPVWSAGSVPPSWPSWRCRTWRPLVQPGRR